MLAIFEVPSRAIMERTMAFVFSVIRVVSRRPSVEKESGPIEVNSLPP